MIGTWTDKFPAERFANQIDWSALLGDATITDCTAEVRAGSVTIVDQSFAGGIQTVWLAGGETGRASVRCQIKTSDGRILEFDARFNVW